MKPRDPGIAHSIHSQLLAEAIATVRSPVRFGTVPQCVFTAICYDGDGNIKWADWAHNLVVNEGLDLLLGSQFLGAGVATWYMGLTDIDPAFAATDTMLVNPGWDEIGAYNPPANRATITWNAGGVSGQLLSNSDSPASYTINADSTGIGGAFVTTDATKLGTTGTLYGGAAFAGGNKVLDTSDVLNVTGNFTAANQP